MNGAFLNYEVIEVNGRKGTFAAYHDDLVIKEPERLQE